MPTTLRNLQAVDFFQNKSAIVESAKKHGISSVYLSPPLDYSQDPEVTAISLIVDSSTCGFAQLTAFKAEVEKMYANYPSVNMSFMDSRAIEETIANRFMPSADLERAKNSAIPLDDLNEDHPLEIQWESQLKKNQVESTAPPTKKARPK